MPVFKLKVFDRMIVVELGKMMLGVMTVLSVILLSQRLVRVLSKVATGDIPTDAVLPMVGLNMALLTIKILPAALLLSILMVLGRMYRDQEMAAVFSAGIGLRKIYRAVFIFALPLFVITFFLSFAAGPYLMQGIEQIKVNSQTKLDIRGITDRRFNEYSRGDLVFYIEKITDDQKMVNVFIQNRQHGKLGITLSKGGEVRVDPDTGDRFIVLKDGNRYEGVPGRADFKLTEFEEYGAVVGEKEDAEIKFGVKEKYYNELVALNSPRASSELQRRWSIPLAVITFALLAVPISRVSPRAGMYGNLLTALLIYIVFENFISLSQSWLTKGVIEPWLGVWWVHLSMVGLAGVMITRMLGFDYVKNNILFKK